MLSPTPCAGTFALTAMRNGGVEQASTEIRPCIDIEKLCTGRVSNVLVEIWLTLGIAIINSRISEVQCV